MYFCDLVITNFNSIKVRLKLINDLIVNAKKAFQFHKGTIKTTQNHKRNENI